MSASEISAGGIVYHRDEAAVLYILMIADRQGRWSFPKGMVGPGETPAQAALREIAEETGVPGIIEAPLGETHYYYRRGGLLVAKTVHFFLVRATATAVQPQLAEVSAARWFPAAAALAASAFPTNTALLRQALARLGSDNPLNLT